jgi:hypothetical protein
MAAAVLLLAPAAFGATYSLNDWCFYVNSLDVNRSCNNGSGVDNFNVSSSVSDWQHLTDGNNLGTSVVTVGPGSYNIFAIYNYDIGGDGGMNEFATVFGSLPIGQVYGVDAQGASGSTPGDLYSQFAGGTLNNTNYIPSCNSSDCPDVAVSLGYTNLVVNEGETAQITFTVGDTPPSSGFYIQQGQNGSGSTLNFSSNVTITPSGGDFGASVVSTPEPGTIGMVIGGAGLMVLGLRRRKKA